MLGVVFCTHFLHIYSVVWCFLQGETGEFILIPTHLRGVFHRGCTMTQLGPIPHSVSRVGREPDQTGLRAD